MQRWRREREPAAAGWLGPAPHVCVCVCVCVRVDKQMFNVHAHAHAHATESSAKAIAHAPLVLSLVCQAAVFPLLGGTSERRGLVVLVTSRHGAGSWGS